MGYKNKSLLNEVIDVSSIFYDPYNILFHMARIDEMDENKGSGTIKWERYSYKVRTSFNQISMPFERATGWEFPDEYGQDKILPFDISFISERVLRLRFSAEKKLEDRNLKSLMLDSLSDCKWEAESRKDEIEYNSSKGSCCIKYDPLSFEIKDSKGKTLIRTINIEDKVSLVNCDPMPTTFVRCTDDLMRYMAISFGMKHDEAFIGCGESFTRLNKRGQKLNLWMCDPKGTMNRSMYKPVPFYISSEGYGIFVHTSAPVTLDLGHSYSSAQSIYVGEAKMDLFIFLGSPKEILDEYTRLTGRSPVPPIWSFGLWMSRISYFSQEEVLETARKLREFRIPCDVIHIDTGWFEVNWRCNYEFSSTRFPEPEEMIRELREDHFKVSIWQMPYINPNNKLFAPMVEKGYAVTDSDGNLPSEDAIIDFSNPDACNWYQDILSKLFDTGVAAIKADFGEAAPLNGAYRSGRSGAVEHNLYPLRYHKAIYDAGRRSGRDMMIWARSGWAGSQRYPIHWGGDSETSNGGMASSLKGGLSLGASGFSFWSHDIGGFIRKSPPELYLRWLAFGMFTSHARCHGQAPKEPWEFGTEFMNGFRKIVEARYSLMPYIYSEAVAAAACGIPMLRALCIDYPDDPLTWDIDSEYMFGSSMLVAPIFEDNGESRYVYLPEGNWIDYQTGIGYPGGRGYTIWHGELPIIILVRDGSVIPHVPAALSTEEIDWSAVYWKGYVMDRKAAGYQLCIPGAACKRLVFDLTACAEGVEIIYGKRKV